MANEKVQALYRTDDGLRRRFPERRPSGRRPEHPRAGAGHRDGFKHQANRHGDGVAGPSHHASRDRAHRQAVDPRSSAKRHRRWSRIPSVLFHCRLRIWLCCSLAPRPWRQLNAGACQWPPDDDLRSCRRRRALVRRLELHPPRGGRPSRNPERWRLRCLRGRRRGWRRQRDSAQELLWGVDWSYLRPDAAQRWPDDARVRHRRLRRHRH